MHPKMLNTRHQLFRMRISLCEKHIRDKVLASMPQYWSILADETQDISTTEQISLCVRCKPSMMYVKSF